MERVCIVDGCSGPHWNRGMCPKHYQRWRKHGHTDDPVRRDSPPCSVDGCDVKSRRNGLCPSHSGRQRRHGDPTKKVYGQHEQRFLLRIQKDDDTGCWLWTGVRHITRGYGRFNVGRRTFQAHRWAYEHFRGPIPEGLTIDHLCRVRHCVNPDHLEPVTQAENNRRAAAARRLLREGP